MPTAISSSYGASLPGSRSPSLAMGKDEFLQLLVAQMKNQDPMSPMKGEEFAAQLAQFSQVEQLMAVRESVDTLAMVNDQTRHIMNTTLATGLIGKSVVVPDSRLVVTEDSVPTLFVEADRATSQATLTVRDVSGAIVETSQLGAVGQGRNRFDLSSLELEPGVYTLSVETTGPDGETLSLVTAMPRTIRGVDFGADGIQLIPHHGDSLRLGDVLEILETPKVVTPANSEEDDAA